MAICLRCVPRRKSWNPLTLDYCINYTTSIVTAAILGSLLDFNVIMVSISVGRRLEMSLKHKVHLGMIFALGDS